MDKISQGTRTNLHTNHSGPRPVLIENLEQRQMLSGYLADVAAMAAFQTAAPAEVVPVVHADLTQHQQNAVQNTINHFETHIRNEVRHHPNKWTSDKFQQHIADQQTAFAARIAKRGGSYVPIPFEALTVGAVAPVPSPTLTATVTNSTTVTLTWTAVTNATKYTLQTSANGSSWSTLSTANVTTFVHSNLKPDTTHKYRVSATVGTKTSPVSAVKSVVTLLTAPSGFHALTNSTTRIDLGWTPVTHTSSYKIERSTNQTTWTTLTPAPAGTAVSFSDTTALAGTTYYYRLSAVETAGTSATSTVVHALTLPAAPVVTATVTSATAINLTWAAVTSATTYKVEKSTDGGGTWTTLGTPSAASYAATGLTADTHYSFRVTTNNATGASAPSATVAATTVLTSPTGLSAVAASPTEIDVAWTDEVDATSYKLERSTDQAAWTALTPAPGPTSATFINTGLSSGTTYYYRLSAVDAAGTSAPSSSVHALTVPGMPTLTATVTSATAVNLSWAAVTGATNYLLEKSTDGGNTWSSVVTQSTLTYANTGLTADTQYKYRVTAIDATGSSNPSAVATATTLLSAPTGLAMTVVSGTEIDLVWTQSDDATGYKLERSPDGNTWAALSPTPALSATSASFNDTTLTAGTTYYYRLSAIDASGTSAASTAIHGLTYPAVPVLTATVGSATTINLSWVAIKSATSYTVQSSTDGGNTWSTLSSPTGLTYANTGLTADTQYKYRIAAVNGTGSSAFTAPTTITTLLTAPSGVTATAISATQVNLTWTPLPDATNYKIERSLDQTAWTAVTAPGLTGASLSFSDTTLTGGTTYYYRISGIDAAGTSAASTVAHALTYPAAPVLTATVGSATSINLAWVAIKSATTYTVESSADGGITWATLSSPTGVTYTNTGLTADTSYKYRVSAVNATGSSAPSAVSTITTLLVPPSDLAATVVSATQINLTWTPIFDSTNYKIERSLNGTTWSALTLAPALSGTSSSYSDTGVTAGTTFYYRISSIDAAGTSAAGTAVHVLTLPAAPTATATVVSATAVNVAWVASTSATSYLLEDSTDGGNTWSTLATQATLTYAHTALTADTQYKYRVTAINGTGNSAASAVATVTTTLPAPSNLAATTASATEIDLTWTALTHATGYKIERSLNQTAWTALTPTPALAGTSASYADTGLTAGTTYYYRISGINSVGTSVASSVVHALTLSGAPVLTATIVSSSQVNLSWTTSPGATSYKVEDSTDGGSTWLTLATLSTTTFMSTGLTADTAYKYRVSAVNSTGNSLASNIASVTTLPAAPTGFGATASTTVATEIDLAWTAVTHATNYKIERSLDNVTFTALTTSLTGTSATFVDTTATAGTTYFYRISTIDAVGTSAPTPVVQALTIPSVPTLSATATATTVSLTWTASTGASSYLLETSVDAGTHWTTLATPAGTSYVDTSVSTDTAYQYRVSAIDATGHSAASTVTNITTLLVAPTGFTATASTSVATQINLAWTDVTDATTYKIERSLNQSTWTALTITPALAGTDAAYSDTTATAGTTFYYRISAIDAAGTSVASTVAHALTIPAVPTLTAAATSASTVNLSWTASTGATNYLLEVSADAGTHWTTAVSQAGITFTATGLTADSAYQYRVSASDATGSSATSTVANTTTFLGAPTGFTATASTTVATEIDLAWTVVADATTYKVERSLNNGTWTTLTITPALAGTAVAYADTGATAGTLFYYRISAVNAVGTSAPATVASALTIPATPTLTATAASATSVNVTWNAVKGATAYLLEVSADAGSHWATAVSQATTTFTATGLTADTAYQYRVSASDATGASPTSTVANVTTILGAPTNFAATASTSALQINLAWTAVTDATGFKLERSLDNAIWTTLSPTPALAGTAAAYADTSVVAGTTYYYRLSAINAVGTSAPAAAVHALTIPAVPTLTATATGATTVNLAWTSVTGATGYLLEVSADAGTHWTTAVSQAGTTFAAGGLTADSPYEYRVSAIDATGSSATSTVANVTTLLPAPTGFTVTVTASATEVDLSWTAVTDATTYKLERSLNGTVWSTLTPMTPLVGTDTSYHDTTVSGGTSYTYRMSAVNALGASATTTPATALTVPVAPVLAATATSATTVGLSWNAVKSATSYLLEVSADSGTHWTTATTQAGTTFTATGLTADTAYEYSVTAINATGMSAVSNLPSVTTFLGAPTGFAATASTSAVEIDLAWTAVTHATGYKLERSLDNTIWTTLSPTPALAGTAAAYADTSVNAGTTYYYRLSAINAVGTSAPATAVHALTIPAVPTLTATVGSATTVNLTWTPSLGATSYLLETSADSGTHWTTAVTQTGTSYAATALTADTAYEYRVSAIDATGSSATSTVANVTTLLNAPAGFTVTASTSVDTEIDLAWTAVTDATGYLIERSLNQTLWTTVTPATALAGTAASYADTTATPGTTFYYRISAIDAAGTSAPATVASALTLPDVPVLETTTVSDTEIDLDWTPVDSATSYLLEKSVDSGTHWTTLATQTSTVFADTGLTTDTTYEYRVTAINATGHSAVSTVQSGTTLLDPPSDLAAAPAAGVSTEVDLTWTATTDATTYLIERSDDNMSWTPLTPATPLVGTSAAFADTTVLAGTQYWYRITAINANGPSAAGNAVSVTTLLNAPTGLTATAASATQINLAWTLDTDAGLTGFIVQSSSDGTHWSDLETVAPTANTASDIRLTTATTYYYRLIAVNAGGNSAPTAAVHATTM